MAQVLFASETWPLRSNLDRIWIFFLKKVSEQHKGKTVLWVTHGGIMWAVLVKVLGLSHEEAKKLRSDNTALSIIELDENGDHKARLVNCVEHLIKV